jgi:hypothetical protein
MTRASRELKIGWQTALTFQAPEPMDRDDLRRLLETMAENGMNFLSIMPESVGRYSPGHDGLCWPTEHPRLKQLTDPSSPNSHNRSEFLAEGIEQARRLGIETNLMLHWHMTEPERLLRAYPGIAQQAGLRNPDLNRTYCSRNPETLRYFLELLDDVVRRYGPLGIHSVTVEGPFGDWCGNCACCRDWYRRTTGTETPQDTMRIVADNLKMREVFSHMARTIKDVCGTIEFWVHSGPWAHRGHLPETLTCGGVDCLMNYFCHDLYEPEAMRSIMEFIAPLPCCPQTCVRDRATHNYFSKPKTPHEARRYAETILETTARAPNGLGAVFFNEVFLSDQTRQAVYQAIRAFTR